MDAARLAAYPGESAGRQPVHTCYVPADAVVPGLARAWGAAALAALDEHGLPDLGLDPAWSSEVLPRVRRKLATEPVEDLRVDAEDGYRGPPDAEDDDVLRAAAVAGRRPGAGTAPPSVGIRAKSPRGADPSPRRPSLDLFLAGARAGRGGPSSRCPRSPTSSRCGRSCRCWTRCRTRTASSLDLELQVETPQAVLGAGRRRHPRPDGAHRRPAG